MRDHLWFPDVDEGVSLDGILDALFGTAIRAHIGKAGGMKSTPAKASAAVANGRKGGRPKKAVVKAR